MIITIARECGSGGHEIGEKLAKELGLEFYDKKRLIEEAKLRSDYDEIKSFFNETPMNSLLYGIAVSYGESRNDNHSFELIRDITAGKDCVIIGRCSNYIYQNYEGLTSVYIHADYDYRVKHIMSENDISKKQAEKMIKETDEKRKEFHKRYTGEQWGLANKYQLTIDSGLIGTENAVNVIKTFIEMKSKAEGKNII